jgi:hypothetical protein
MTPVPEKKNVIGKNDKLLDFEHEKKRLAQAETGL